MPKVHNILFGMLALSETMEDQMATTQQHFGAVSDHGYTAVRAVDGPIEALPSEAPVHMDSSAAADGAMMNDNTIGDPQLDANNNSITADGNVESQTHLEEPTGSSYTALSVF